MAKSGISDLNRTVAVSLNNNIFAPFGTKFAMVKKKSNY